MAENTIDNLSIEVTTSADSATRTFDRLASGMGRVRSAASGTASGMRDTANAAEDMADVVEDAGTATVNAGTQTGYAESHIRRFARALMTTSSQTIGRFITAVNRGASAVGGFIRQIARILMYRSIRSLIKDLGQSFRDLYGWSRMFGTDFANSMDKINTSAVYLRNSFAAMVAPIINALAPAIDVIADKIVDIFNFVNQVFAALSGAETYTVAKKVAQSWESTFDSASRKAKKTAKEIRNTLLGFDEINRLNGNTPTSTGSTGSSPYTPGYNTMFEEKPLKGFFKQISDFTSKMPDWLKWLFGGAALVGGFLLIRKFIPWLLKKLGELFSLKIPNWLKWLFGPKKDKDVGFDLPDGLNIPDADIKVDLEKGDWDILDDLEVPVKLNNSPKSLWENFKKGWLSIEARIVYITPILNNTAKTLFDNFKKDWDRVKTALYVTPALNNTGKTLFNSLKKNWDSNKKKLFVTPDLDNTGKVLFETLKKSWDEAKTKLYATPELNNTGKVLFNTLKKNWNDNKSILYAKPDLNNTGKTLFNNLKKNWDENKSKLYAEPALNTTGAEMFYEFKDSWDYRKSDLGVNVALEYTGSEAFYDFKSDWDYFKTTLYATPELNNTGKTLFNELKDSWDWHKTKLYATPSLNTTGKAIWLEFKKSWNNAKTNLKASVTVSTKKTGSYGGANGAGGTTSGSGAGRNRHALGGVITPHSESWFGKITSYASGTTNAHGTMFLAGENGPEIMGHIGGRTEILNRSQLAATMYSAVRNAMSGVTLEANFNNVDTGANSVDSMEMLAEMVRQGVEQAMARQNELDRQRNEYLRQINDKDYNLDISTASINKAQTRTNRRAGTTIVPVGT